MIFIRVKLLLDMAISTGAITVLAWLLFIQPNALINVIPELDAFTYTLILIDISLFAILLNLALIALQPAIQRRMLVYVVGVFFLALGDISVLLAPALHEVQPGTSLGNQHPNLYTYTFADADEHTYAFLDTYYQLW